MLTNLKQWKKIILSLPDEDFFEIMRNYLGELKTPFNKHILIEQLLTFLSKDTTVERIVSLINNTDAVILTLIYSLGGPTVKTLYGFVKDSQSFLEFQNHILNLEERLLIYEEPDTGRVLISPLFKTILEERVLDTRRIFPSEKIISHRAAPPWFSEALLVAIISFFKDGPELFKLDGTLKKRSKDEISSLFPLLFTDTPHESRFEILFSTLLKLHLITENRGRISIHYKNLSRFSDLPILHRYSLFLAAAAMHSHDKKTISELSRLLSSFLNSLPEMKGFTRSTLLSLLQFFTQGEEIDDKRLQGLIDTLIAVEILYPYTENLYALNPFFTKMLHENEEEPALIIQPSFIITAKPWITLETGIPLALSSDIVKYDIFTEYEITKQSCVKIRRINMNQKELFDYLERMSGGSVPQNIKTSLEHWAADYNTFQLFEGITLVVSNSRRVIIDHLEALKPFIKSNPAPGVYVFNKEEEREWSKLLIEAGMPILTEPEEVPVSEDFVFPSDTHQKKGELPTEITFIEQKHFPREDKPLFLKELKEIMNTQNFSETEHEDISARIERKLILFPAQLKKTLKSKDKAEVGGLDYTGKIRLIQRALDSKRNILEIKSPILPGNTEKILIKPVTVNHQEGDLVLLAQTLPEENEIEIPIRKISYVKLLKSSLYAPVSG